MIELRNQKYKVPSTSKATKLVASAILQNGYLWTGKRHGLIIHKVFEDTGQRVSQDHQGFLTDDHRFVCRKVGEVIAKANGQIPKDFDKYKLTSEDLW